MASRIPGPRKQRTRQHVIADLGVHHVERFILEEGHTAQPLGSDYGYDLIVWTFDEQGYAEPGAFYMQLKAMETVRESGKDCLFDLDVRDCNLWTREEMPVLLVLYDAARKRAYWLAVQQYFQGNVSRRPKPGAKSVRVRVPKRPGREPASDWKNARTEVGGDSPRTEGRTMTRTDVTYGQLDRVLRSRSFSCRPSKQDPPGRIYEHAKTGAIIMLPAFPDSDRVFEHHLVAARMELDHFGLADPTVFAAKLQKAG